MRFIRKNGRIIPIGEKSYKKKEVGGGSAEIAAGAAVAAGGGIAGAKMLKHSQQIAGEARETYKIAKTNFRAIAGSNLRHASFLSQNSRTLRQAVGRRAVAKQIFRARNPFLQAVAVATGGLISHGAGRVADALSTKDNLVAGRTSRSAGAVSAAAITAASYYGARGHGPLETVANTVARVRGVSRPFKKYGPKGPV